MTDSSGIRYRNVSLSPNDTDANKLSEFIYGLAEELYPICRSITGHGVRKTLDIIGKHVPLEVFEVPSGTQVLDWTVPREWNIEDAYIRDANGEKVVDFSNHNLHVVSYSVPVNGRMTLDELRPHLHSLPEHPNWIPYRTSYYHENWGFCLQHSQLERMTDDVYDVVIDSTLEDGSLTYAECLVEGENSDEVLIYTHTCHPSMANDNTSGMALVTLLAREIGRSKPRLSYRFVFGPGTIGSITWLARNQEVVDRVRHGLVVGLVGDSGPLTFKCSRNGSARVDHAMRHMLADLPEARVESFSPFGYDERQFCSPGYDLPVGRLTRSPEDSYPEYHTSADNLEFLNRDSLAESYLVCRRALGALDVDMRYVNLSPKGEPQLGKRGLYRKSGGEGLPGREFALLWVLNQSDGSNSLLEIAEKSGLSFEVIHEAARDLETAGLMKPLDRTRSDSKGARQ